MPKDVFHQPDCTPEELRLIEKRKQLRRALRAEYLRKLTDPHGTEPIVFDPAVQRYYSMHMTASERFVPTFKNWLGYMCSIIIPVVGYAMYLKKNREWYEKRYRSGEIEYKDRFYRHQ